MSDNQVTVRAMHVTAWQGPIPPADMAERYEKIHPGAFRRMLKLAEDESAHRRIVEKTAQGEYHKSVRVGMTCAFVLTIMAFICATVCACLGHTTAAVAFVGATVVNLAATFIGRKQ